MEFSFRRFKKPLAILAVGMAVSLTAVDFAEARRGGGGFGSRGTRTHSAPATTQTAPAPAGGIERSMTPRPQGQANQQNAARQTNAAQQQQRRPGGMFGGLMGGLLLGGLFGMLLGHGFGGLAGFFGLLLQVALIAGLAFLALRLFSNRRQPAGSGAGAGRGNNAYRSQAGGGFDIPAMGSGARAGGAAAATQAPRAAGPETDEIGIGNRDLDQFEKLLGQVQSAYADEDYARLRAITTPEAMSYLAEELGENATSGVKNVVRDVVLLQGDLSEAWRENGQDFATVAMRYSSIDYMVDRNSGAVVEGDDAQAGETVEVWTFTRKPAGEWQLAAIQNAG